MGRAQYLVEFPKVQISFCEFFPQGNVQGDFGVVVVRAQVQVLVQGVLDHEGFVAVQAGSAQLRVQQRRDGQEPLPQRRQERLVHAQLVQQNLCQDSGGSSSASSELCPPPALLLALLKDFGAKGKGRRIKVERDGGKHRVIRLKGECSLQTLLDLNLEEKKHRG